jgi:hypothetical protein
VNVGTSQSASSQLLVCHPFQRVVQKDKGRHPSRLQAGLLVLSSDKCLLKVETNVEKPG